MATYQEQTGGTLPFYNEAYQRLIQDAEARAKQQMGMTPPPQTVAGFTPMQEEAFKLAGSSVGQYAPWLEQAQQFATQAGQGAQFDPSQVQQYLNPYLSGVVGEIGRLGQEQFQQQVIPGITSAMGGLGQFGSARQAAMLADASGRSQREILGQQANALNTGYNQAMGAYQDWTQMGLGAQQQAAQQLGNLAQAGQGMTAQDIAQLSTAGKTQQDLAQQQANLPFTNWMTQQQYPWQVQNQWANLFKTAPTSQTSWNTGFKKGGLARFADGGGFSWQVSPEDQRKKDDRRVDILLAEYDQNPDDPALIEELSSMGVKIPVKPRTPRVARSVALEPVATEPMVAQSIATDGVNPLVKRAFEERMGILDRARNLPELQTKPDPHWAESAGRAMMEASAKGPANIGQLIGRSGEAYFAGEDAREEARKNLALARLGLEEKIVGDPGDLLTRSRIAAAGGSGAMSIFGKMAADEGFNPGTPEHAERVQQLIDIELGRKQYTADTSRGHLNLRGREQIYKYGGPGDSGIDTTAPSTAAPVTSAPSTAAPVTSAPSTSAPSTTAPSTAAPPDMHPGISKYMNQGMPRVEAMKRFEVDQKEFDKMRNERSDAVSALGSGDIDRALTLNEQIEKTRTLPAVAFEMGPEWLPGATAAMGSKTGEYRSELNAIGARMIPALTKGLTPVSNVDAQSMSKAGVGAKNSYVVNKTNLQRAKSSEVLLKEQDTFYSQAQEMGLSPSEAKTEWNKYISKNRLFDATRAAKDGALIYKTPLDNRPAVLENHLVQLRKKRFGTRSSAPETESESEVIEIRPEDLQ